MKSINEDIKNRQFNRVYLFTGEESYLRNQYSKKLRDAIAGDSADLNVCEYSGNSIDVNEVIDYAETAPFMGEYRVIFISDSNLFSTQQDALADYIKAIPETTTIIFSQEEVDKKRRLYKAIKDNGRIIECQRQTEDMLAKWIMSKLKADNKEITSGALRLFLNRVGDDMEVIQTELEKLICYTMNKSGITEADVMTICSERIQDKVFEMLDLMSTGDQKRALSLYHDLLTLKVEPIKILVLIARQYNLLFQIKSLRKRGADKKTMASVAKVSPYFVDKYISISNRYSENALRDAMEMCAEHDQAFKSGRLNDTMAVELLIVKFSSESIR